MEIQQQTIPTNRLTFSCRVAGNPDDMPVLLVHGSFASSRWWEPFMHVLPEGFFLVAPDLRGCGGTPQSSDNPDTAYTIEAQAQDLAGLVDVLGWDEFELVGHSSGGAIAMEFALSFPERARSLTLVDSAPIEGVFTPVDVLMLLAQMRTDRELLTQALAALMPTFPGATTRPTENASPHTPDTFRTYFEALVDDAQQMAPAAFTAVAEALGSWNRFADARYLTLPTLLIWGNLDSVVDRDSTTRTLIAIPGAGNLDVIRNVGHSPMIEAPVALAERFIEFVTEDLEDFEQVRRDAL